MSTIKLNIKGYIKEYNISDINRDADSNYTITFASDRIDQVLVLTEILIKSEIDFNIHNDESNFIIKFQYDSDAYELSEKDAIKTNVRSIFAIVDKQNVTLSYLKDCIDIIDKTINSFANTKLCDEIFAKYFKDELLTQRNSLNNALRTMIADKEANLKLLSVYKRDLEWYRCNKHEAK